MMNGQAKPSNKRGSSSSGFRDESFYQPLEESENNSEIIEIEGNEDKYDQIQLYMGEKFTIEEPFVIREGDGKLYTELYLTNYRLIIVRKDPISIPYGYIAAIIILINSLKIELKTGVCFEIQPERNFKDVKAYIEHGFNQLPFCLQTTCEEKKASIYDSYAEIQRMRVDSEQYKIYKNFNHKFCATYPLYIVIPKAVEVNNMAEIKKCRIDGRIPVMSFYDDEAGVGIWRASKVFKEIPREVSKYDQAYLQEISKDLVILAIQMNGNYKNSLSFETLEGLRRTYHNYVSEYSKTLTSSPCSRAESFLKMQGRWYQEIDKLISLSYYIVSKIKDKKHVLLEESLALDRVPQLISLASIVIDPFYRTFDGLSILIEKEFICFGHPFEARCGFTKNPEESSPIFIQFLQAVNQLIVTHPECFEYSSAYLASIGYEVFTTRFMNFVDHIGNPAKEERLLTCTSSIWDKDIRKKSHHNFQYQSEHLKQLWQVRRKPSVKEYLTWNEYFEPICRMNYEKKHPLDPLGSSRRLSQFLTQKQID